MRYASSLGFLLAISACGSSDTDIEPPAVPLTLADCEAALVGTWSFNSPSPPIGECYEGLSGSKVPTSFTVLMAENGSFGAEDNFGTSTYTPGTVVFSNSQCRMTGAIDFLDGGDFGYTISMTYTLEGTGDAAINTTRRPSVCAQTHTTSAVRR